MTNRSRKSLVLCFLPLLLVLGFWWALRDDSLPATRTPERPPGRERSPSEAAELTRLVQESATGVEHGPPPEEAAAGGATEETERPDEPDLEGPSELLVDEGTIDESDIQDWRLIDFDGSVRLHDSLKGARLRVELRNERGGSCSVSSTSSSGVESLLGLGFECEPGIYTMEASAEKDGVLVRVKRTISIGQGPVNLPVVELVPMAGVRARVVDANGTPALQARILVVRPEELAGGGRRIEPGPEGWIHYADLEPGVDHRLVVEGLPERIERVVRVPLEPKGTAVEEVRLASRLVPVKLRFATRDGKTIAFKAVEPSISNTGHRWKNCEELPDRLLPGDYEFHAEKLVGRVTIPPDRPFEGTIRMEPVE